MNVNFNNLRKQALYSYDALTKVLNENIEDGSIRIDVEDIRKEMDDLRMQLFGIACTYIDGDDDFKDISEEVGEIASFNEEE